jgi:hypothetical protein
MFVPVPNLITKELLIDFRELIREHSGENLAEAVYETLQLYELIDPSTSAELLQEVLTAVETVNPLLSVQKYD